MEFIIIKLNLLLDERYNGIDIDRNNKFEEYVKNILNFHLKL